MYLDDKVQQLKDYFSNEKFDKAKEVLKKVDNFFSSPYTTSVTITATALVLFFIVLPNHVRNYTYENLAKPLIKIQHERFKKDAEEMGIEYNVTLEERLVEHLRRYMPKRTWNRFEKKIYEQSETKDLENF